MFRKLLSVLDNGGTISSVVRQDVLDALNGNFPGMYDYFRQHKNWQHQQMAKHYVSKMVQFLKDYSNNSFSQGEYEALAWEGLRGTVA